MHLFVARFSDILDVVITCDGCDTSLSGRRYRCLNCPDVDLCNNCHHGKYKSAKQTIFETKPENCKAPFALYNLLFTKPFNTSTYTRWDRLFHINEAKAPVRPCTNVGLEFSRVSLEDVSVTWLLKKQSQFLDFLLNISFFLLILAAGVKPEGHLATHDVIDMRSVQTKATDPRMPEIDSKRKLMAP